jgi:hypothetical protein
MADSIHENYAGGGSAYPGAPSAEYMTPMPKAAPKPAQNYTPLPPLQNYTPLPKGGEGMSSGGVGYQTKAPTTNYPNAPANEYMTPTPKPQPTFNYQPNQNPIPINYQPGTQTIVMQTQPTMPQDYYFRYQNTPAPPRMAAADTTAYLQRLAEQRIAPARESTYSGQFLKPGVMGLEHTAPAVAGVVGFLGEGVVNLEKSAQGVVQESHENPAKAFINLATAPVQLPGQAVQATTEGRLPQFARDVAIQSFVFSRVARFGGNTVNVLTPELKVVTTPVIGKTVIGVELPASKANLATGEQLRQTYELGGKQYVRIAEQPFHAADKVTATLSFPNLRLPTLSNPFSGMFKQSPQVFKPPQTTTKSIKVIGMETAFERIAAKPDLKAITGKDVFQEAAEKVWYKQLFSGKPTQTNIEPKPSNEGKGGMTTGTSSLNFVTNKDGTISIQEVKQKPVEAMQLEKTIEKTKTSEPTRALEKIGETTKTKLAIPIISLTSTKTVSAWNYKPKTMQEVIAQTTQRQKERELVIFPTITKTAEITSQPTKLADLQRMRTLDLIVPKLAQPQAQKTALEQAISSTATKTVTKQLQVLGYKYDERKQTPFFKRGERGYLVIGRKKGKEIVISRGALVKEEAISLGTSFVKAGAQQTFRIRPTSRLAERGRFGLRQLREQLYTPKTIKPMQAGEEVFTQKAKFKIATRAEVSDLFKARKRR